MIKTIEDKGALIEEAKECLQQGKLVILPTETVYGLGADATNGDAIAAIYAIKGRPDFNPLIAHMYDIAMVEEYCILDPLSRKLMEKFWPGPISFVLPLKPEHDLHPNACAGLRTLAVRCPLGIFRDIIGALGKPIVAPSANISGRLSPTTAKAAASDLGDKVDLIIDGGACSIGLESTIVKILPEACYLLRPGGISKEEILAHIDRPLLSMDHDQAIEAPGMLASHYAPRALIRLNAQHVEEGEALLRFGQGRVKNMERANYVLNLSESADLQEAALRLFAYLRRLDKEDVDRIAVQTIPNCGLGEAINDRLLRAAAPRENNRENNED